MEEAGFEPERKRPSPIQQNDDLHCDTVSLCLLQNLIHARGRRLVPAVRVIMVDLTVRRVADKSALPVVMARRRRSEIRRDAISAC